MKLSKIRRIIDDNDFELQTANVIEQQHDLLLFKAAFSFKNQVKNSTLHVEFDDILRKINLVCGSENAPARTFFDILSEGCLIKKINLWSFNKLLTCVRELKDR